MLPLIEEPFRNRSDGVSQGQRFPFELPIPGSQALKTMDWSVFLPISSSPGFWKGERLPYSFHWNFNIQRQLAKNMVASVGYVGTAGRKLMAQYESNPGDPALCLSLRGDRRRSRHHTVRPQPGRRDLHPPGWQQSLLNTRAFRV